MCLPRWRIQSIVFLIAVRDFTFGNQNVTKQHSVAAGNALAMLVDRINQRSTLLYDSRDV